MRSADDSDSSREPGQSFRTKNDQTTPSWGADEHRAEGQVDTARVDVLVSQPNSRSRQTGNRRRRNRRSAEQPQGRVDPQPERLSQNQAASPKPEPKSQPAATGNPSPPVKSSSRDQPTMARNRSDPPRESTREAGPELRRRRTEGTRPPDQGNGRGLSGSPRNPNHYGEIPIRPDNSTFDATSDRLVCIARSHIIPEDFPVQYRRMTASSQMKIVATSGLDLLLCDHSHGGPHVWPDQTVVAADPDSGNPWESIGRPETVRKPGAR